MGVVAPRIRRAFDLKQEVYYLEMNFDALVKSTRKHRIAFEELSKFPEVKRDLALLVDRQVTFAQLLRHCTGHGAQVAEKCVSLFDVYEGDKLPEGKEILCVEFRVGGQEPNVDRQGHRAGDEQLAGAVRTAGRCRRAVVPGGAEKIGAGILLPAPIFRIGASVRENGNGSLLPLLLLGFLPERFLLVGRQIGEHTPLSGGGFLHRGEAADELAVGAFECGFGIDSVEPAGVDQREEEVAELPFHRFVIAAAHFGLDFRRLFADFRPDVFASLPVESAPAAFSPMRSALTIAGRLTGTPPSVPLRRFFLRSLSASQLRFTSSGVSAWMSP